MKRILFISALLLASIIASAQTQQGYVKTKGRLDSNGNLIPGRGLKGATVSVHGRAAVLVNADDGSFSFPVPESQYSLDSVRKKGYQLVDMDAFSKTYSYSSNPLYLVMETPEQMIEDQMDNFARINAAQQRQIMSLRAEVKQLKTEKKLSEEEYSKRLQEIADMQSESQQLVDEMVEHYSKIDYDQLSEFDQLISKYILDGELLKADSMLHTKGNLDERVEQYKRDEATIAKEREELSLRQEQLEQSEVLRIKRLDDLANDCYHKFEIHKLKHENDSAAYYIELRAGLDTTNVEWQFKAGEFFDYIADYSRAIAYFQRALQLWIKQYGESYEETASLYQNIGLEYQTIGNYEDAFTYYNKALEIRKSIFGENAPEIASNYKFLGSYYRQTGDYEKATEFNEAALTIYKNAYGENNEEVASIYGNLGVVFEYKGEYQVALEFHQKALGIDTLLFDKNNPQIATDFYNIGSVYKQLGDYPKAIENYEKSLGISINAFGENHPDVAFCYNNIGNVYSILEEPGKEMESYEKALTIFKSIFGDKHVYVAICYSNIGSTLSTIGDYERALEYNQKSLEIQKKIFGDSHPDVAGSYNNIGSVYYEMKNYSMAQEYMEKALAIMQVLLGENHPNIAVVYSNIAVICNKQAKYDQSIEYLEKALAIDTDHFGEMHAHVASDYISLSFAYEKKGDFKKALEYARKSLSIRESVLGSDHSKTQTARQAVEEINAKILEQENKPQE